MTDEQFLRREALVSAAINGVLSAVFFVIVFGLTSDVPLPALGADCLPQAFMVSLMGSLVPALLLRRRRGGAVPRIVWRALLLAIAGATVAGGGAYLVAGAVPTAALSPGAALAAKMAFGALLGAVVTPLALRPMLRTR